MLEKIELRTKLKSISMVDAIHDASVINRLNEIIKDKIVCTYVPIKNEININTYLYEQALLTTTCVTDENIKVSFLIFISFFISLFILSGILIVDKIDFEESFKLSILTITNTTTSQMYGLDKLDFANLLTTSKLSLIIFMIIGKIELISIFLIIKKIFFKD